jgi:hypothetical protein
MFCPQNWQNIRRVITQNAATSVLDHDIGFQEKLRKLATIEDNREQ